MRADDYSQPPPTSGTKPEPNVIIQLCDSGNSNSGVPLTDPSNAEFAGLVKGWSKLTQRLWIWNYVCDFGDYLQSYPNYYVVGPNIKFFADHGVKGVCEYLASALNLLQHLSLSPSLSAVLAVFCARKSNSVLLQSKRGLA